MVLPYMLRSPVIHDPHPSTNNQIPWAPLNEITLGPRQTDSINQMIPLTDTHIAFPRTNRPWIPKKN